MRGYLSTQSEAGMEKGSWAYYSVFCLCSEAIMGFPDTNILKLLYLMQMLI